VPSTKPVNRAEKKTRKHAVLRGQNLAINKSSGEGCKRRQGRKGKNRNQRKKTIRKRNKLKMAQNGGTPAERPGRNSNSSNRSLRNGRSRGGVGVKTAGNRHFNRRGWGNCHVQQNGGPIKNHKSIKKTQKDTARQEIKG